MTTSQIERAPAAPLIDLGGLLTGQRDAAKFLMAELPPDGRRAVELLYLEGRSVSEVAHEMRMPLGAAVDLVERTVDLLRVMARLLFPELCGEAGRKDDAA